MMSGPGTGPDRRPFQTDRRAFYLNLYGTEKPPLRRRVRVWAGNLGFHCVAVFRFGQWARRARRKVGPLAWPLVAAAKCLSFQAGLLHKVFINDQAEIGPGLLIFHPGNIVVGPVTIGAQCALSQGVTIGYGHTPGRQGRPRIGSRFWAYQGAVIYGAIEVGDGVTVLNYATVSKDIPQGSVVAGNPGRIIERDFDNRVLWLEGRD